MPSSDVADGLRQIEQAILRGDLSDADRAMQVLKPLLVTEQVEQLKHLKAQVADMVVVVRRQMGEQASALKQIKRSRTAINQYRAQQGNQAF